MNTLNKLQQFLAGRFAIGEDEIQPATTLDRLGIDSLAALELVFELEDEFGIRLDTDSRGIRTIADLVAIVDRQLGDSNDQAPAARIPDRHPASTRTRLGDGEHAAGG